MTEEARIGGSSDELPVPAPRLYRSRSLEEQLAGRRLTVAYATLGVNAPPLVRPARPEGLEPPAC